MGPPADSGRGDATTLSEKEVSIDGFPQFPAVTIPVPVGAVARVARRPPAPPRTDHLSVGRECMPHIVQPKPARHAAWSSSAAEGVIARRSSDEQLLRYSVGPIASAQSVGNGMLKQL